MKKKTLAVLLTTAMTASALGAAGCGKQLTLTSDKVSMELGNEINTNVADYVSDADVAAETTIDFSGVDTATLGTYTATVTYKDQTVDLTVDVVDTTAPVAELTSEKIVLGAGEALTAEDVITGVTEASKNVTAAFSEQETETTAEEAVAEGTEATENVAETEAVETTETAEASESVETTETTETTGDAISETFVLEDVTISNDEISFAEAGEYTIMLTLSDASGNNSNYPLDVMVGSAPVFSGIKDLEVTVGDESVDYLSGVTAVDCNGNDLTSQIACDDSAVDLGTVGEYEVKYTVVDENGFTAEQTAKIVVKEAEKAEKTAKDTKTDKTGKTAKSDSAKSDSKKTNSTATSTGTTNTNSSSNSGSSSNTSANTNAGSNSGSSSNTSANTNAGSNSESSSNTSANTNAGSNSESSSNSGSSANTPSGSSNSENSGSTGNSGSVNAGNTASTPSAGTGASSTPSTPSESTSTPSTDTGTTSGDAGTSTPSNSTSGSTDADNSIPLDPSLGDNSNANPGNGVGWDATVTVH